MRQILVSSAAQDRIAAAERWLEECAPSEEVLVVTARPEAGAELVRAVAERRGAVFGWQRVTLGRLAGELATPALVADGLAPVGALASEAVVARVVHALAAEGRLGRYAEVADGPGFPRAVARTVGELRLAGLGPEALAEVAPELGALQRAYLEALVAAGLVDRPGVFAVAARAAGDAALRHPWLGRPLLLVDVPLEGVVEAELVGAVAARAARVLATVPAGDARTARRLEAALGVEAEADGAPGGGALQRLQAYLFEDAAPPRGAVDDDVVVLSAPGESRECVEIARQVVRHADAGVPFDRMAVLLRSPESYRPHLEEAFGRARIPAWFARGAVRPDPAGRAFLALLACAAERLSARRFAEYLSLGEVPDADAGGAPPEAPSSGERWVPPDEELVSEPVAAALEAAAVGDGDDEDGAEDAAAGVDPDVAAVRAGTLRAPQRWEALLVDAAVIGGRERWSARLDALERELELDRDALDDPDDPRAEGIGRSLAELDSLRRYALPLVDALAALPESGTWGEWLDRLSALATRAVRHPDRILAVLGELAPMAPIGPVGLDEVRLVLASRLLELALPPPRSRYGRVLVAPAEAARGLAFDVVFVPGLAEKLFPHKIAEDPILLDGTRRRLGTELDTNDERVARERRALRLAVGAARAKVVLSYPRLDPERARPRVPSFYALEALRAAEGTLPGFDELADRADTAAQARIGWPAPRAPEDAIDEAEHDLALLQGLMKLDPERAIGTARYLLTANPHLGRALRFRARRWLRSSWTAADGLVKPTDAARAALAAHQLGARSFSPTALQNYAACPYKFFLYAVQRLAPREQPEAIEEMDPLQRGSLVHDVLFELGERLRDAELLPVRPDHLERARAILDTVLDAVAARYAEQLAPAIERVWRDGIEAIRADLREWLRRAAVDPSGFVPWRFELGFGLGDRRAADPASQPDPVALDCGLRLRGSIDLVERRGDGELRVTDYKTGKARVPHGAIVRGGEALQPVFYALAVEKLFPDVPVASGRLYYCTSAGGFEEITVALDREARRSADVVASAIGEALERAFLPAAPADGACRWCDYKLVCGPYEELRTRRKPQRPLGSLRGLREMK